METATTEIYATHIRALYPQIYDFDNLYTAWRRARRGGKRKWPSVAAFEIDLEQNSAQADCRIVPQGGCALIRQKHKSAMV